MPPAASAETPVAALGLIEVARANAPPSLTMTPLLRMDLSCATSPTGCRTEVREGKTSPFCRWGSRGQVRSPSGTPASRSQDESIRSVCPACLSGEQHQSYVLYGRANGRRVAVYVPEELVPEVQRSLDNGRALQDLLHQAAPRYIKALKRERAEAKKSDEG